MPTFAHTINKSPGKERAFLEREAQPPRATTLTAIMTILAFLLSYTDPINASSLTTIGAVISPAM
jgi:hypothetical protein